MAAEGKTWASRIALAACALALVATSKPRGWRIDAAITAPTTAPLPRALWLEIDATHKPTIHATGQPNSYQGRDAPCLQEWSTRRKSISCLLPPGVTLDGVDIGQSCGGCSGTCPPPPGAAITVKTSETDVWTDHAASSLGVTLPSHPKDFVGSRIAVMTRGADFIEAKIDVAPRAGGPAIMSDTQSCEIEATAPKEATCTFLVWDSALAGNKDFDVVATLTGFGACGTPGCAAPKTLVVTSIAIVK